MKLTVLVENIASAALQAEWGLSYIIESDEKILFDTGASELFKSNAKKLNENLDEIEKVVLSHGHWDHGSGLIHLSQKKLYAHPDIFKERFSGSRSIGLPFTRDEIEEKMDLLLSEDSRKVSENITFLGQIPRSRVFENKGALFTDKNGNPDDIADDSAIAVVEDGKLIVITGCAHAGLINTVEHAKKVTGITDLYAVIGGFHLQGHDQITKETIAYLQEQKVTKVYPSHCNQFPALAEFYQIFGAQPLKAGDMIDFT